MTRPVDSAEDPKSQRILRGAAKVFSDKGYHNASMRDIAAETGISLAGMYYYFASKEEMLFSIQRYCFERVLASLNQRVEGLEDPAERLRAFIHNHLAFFIDNVREMKVLSHESDSLTGDARREIAGMKRSYFHALTDILRDIPGQRWSESEIRQVGLSIFGMVNWIYTWYDADRDGTAEELTATMCDLVTTGVLGSRT